MEKNSTLSMNEDPHFGSDGNLIRVGSKVPDFTLQLAQNSEFRLSSILARGPLIVNFIKGSWCLYCQMHLRNLHEWQESIRETHQESSVTIVVISNESIDKIKKWIKSNPVSYLY